MIALTKLLGYLLLPTGLLWLGLLWAAVWAFRRRSRGLGAWLVLLFLGFTLAGNLQLGHLLMAQLESSIPQFPADGAPLDALFVLGGGTEVASQGSPLLKSSGDRVLEAARLWHAGRVKRLVASGTSDDDRRGRRDLGLETRAIWMDLGIPTEAIQVIEEPCLTTRDEIKAYTRLQAREGWHRVGLLSSAWHLPRALALARRNGLDVIPIPSDRRGRIPKVQLWHLVPQQEGFQNTQLACWEVLGRWVGR
jgi:uncharacterized SAM-binding protein YcdF (DUF218 family)